METKGHNGTVIFDGDFVTIRRTGFLARASVGKGEKRIVITSINAVQWKPAGALVNGYIQFTLGGGNEVRGRFGSQTTDAVKDENSVLFTKKQMPKFETLLASVEQAIATVHRPTISNIPTGQDLVAQLKHLAELRDAGIVTDDEFAAKKAEILSRM